MSSSYSGWVPEWIENNKKFAADEFPSLPAPWKMADFRQQAMESGKTTLVLTCLDPRCVPETFFGPGFQGGVIHNAGGRATDDAIRSLTILKALAGMNTVVVVHHTDCGVTHLTDQEVIDTLAQDGTAAGKAAEAIEYKLFRTDDLVKSVKEDVHVLKNAPTLAGVNVYGFTLDTFTGKVEPVGE